MTDTIQVTHTGLIGLGTMGSALALNIAEKACPIAVYNRSPEKTHAFMADAGTLLPRITPTFSLDEFVAALAEPRSIILMLTAGDAVDQQIAALRPLLGPDDLIIDAGNANFHDTNRRAAASAAQGELFIGMGVSGGEWGARHGPSIMVGGPKAAFARLQPMLQAIAAHYNGVACAEWMGDAGAGHFVKTVHNGIEYADMQMIAEAYGIMRDGMERSSTDISDIFAAWNRGVLKSYLIEISGKVAGTVDDATGKPILDVILDRAGQKGTGRWTIIEAQHIGAPVTVIEAAVAARNLSSQLDFRKDGAAIFGEPDGRGINLSVDELEQALIAGKIMCYAQGFDLLARAESSLGWRLPLGNIASVWREGCIIRSEMLNDMASALTQNPERNLLFAEPFTSLVRNTTHALRTVVANAALHGLPTPALSAAIAYFDTVRTRRTNANMIQGQRDFFGMHSFERIDQPGAHHGNWVQG